MKTADHIDGAINIPASELPMRFKELPSDVTIVTACNLGGARSCGAAERLQSLGYRSAFFEVARVGGRATRIEIL